MAIVEGVQAPVNDVTLVQRMARGDEEAAYGLIAAHGDPLFRFVLRRMNGLVEDAEDIVQETFLAAVRMAKTYDGNCTVFTWLCSLARLKIGDHLKLLRTQKRSAENAPLALDDDEIGLLRRIHDPSITIDEIVDGLDRVRLVQALLDSMTVEQREAVALRYVEQFSVSEIARIMGRSEKAVERLLERAKEKPRQEIFRWFGDEPFRAMCFELLTL